MPKHNLRTLVEEEPKEEKKFQAVEPKILPSVNLRLRIDANYKITGKYSGQEYYFAGAGSTGNVDERDVEWLLSLRQGKGCCGGGGGNNVFELAGE